MSRSARWPGLILLTGLLAVAGLLAPAAGGVVRPADDLRADREERIVPGEAIVRFAGGADSAE
ncbi:MAG TPA: hypothetical protein VHG69_06270, partial [Thermoleophilaceae bacterium]|nr:hypothetical protein [Thermoleophilaceae bacterium]